MKTATSSTDLGESSESDARKSHAKTFDATAARQSAINDDGPFPVDALNGPMRAIVEAISTAHRLPVGLPAVTALVAASAALGKSVCVQDAVIGLTTHVNIYAILGAETGGGKGLTTQILRPFSKLSHERSERHTNNIPALKAELRRVSNLMKHIEKRALGLEDCSTHDCNGADPLWTQWAALEKKRDALKALLKHPPTFWTGSTTPEGLRDIARRNDGQLFSFVPEAGQIFRLLFSRPGDFDLLLIAASVEPHAEGRAGTGHQEMLPCFCILWFAQPSLIKEFVGNPHVRPRGFLARTHFVIMPTPPPVREVGDPPVVSVNAANAWEQHVRMLFGLRDSGPHSILCSPQARETFRSFENETIALRLGEFRDSPEELRRAREQAIKIAGVLVACDALTASDQDDPPFLTRIPTRSIDADIAPPPNDQFILTAEHADRAVRITRWLLGQSLKLVNQCRGEHDLQRLQKLQRVVEKHGGQVTLRDLRDRHTWEETEVRELVTRFPLVLEIADVRNGPVGRMSTVLRRVSAKSAKRAKASAPVIEPSARRPQKQSVKVAPIARKRKPKKKSTIAKAPVKGSKKRAPKPTKQPKRVKPKATTRRTPSKRASSKRK